MSKQKKKNIECANYECFETIFFSRFRSDNLGVFRLYFFVFCAHKTMRWPANERDERVRSERRQTHTKQNKKLHICKCARRQKPIGAADRTNKTVRLAR